MTDIDSVVESGQGEKQLSVEELLNSKMQQDIKSAAAASRPLKAQVLVNVTPMTSIQSAVQQADKVVATVVATTQGGALSDTGDEDDKQAQD